MNDVSELNRYLNLKKKLIECFLDEHLPKLNEKPSIIHEAMRYSLFAGGKRFRPLISLMINEMLGGNEENVLYPACAIELIHTYSLIHDDLPAIDDDNFRRGKLSNHKKFGEAIAILAGDALLTFAFELISKAHSKSDLLIQIIQKLSFSAGSKGMIGGQVADIQAEKNPKYLNNQNIKKELNYIHLHKTGILIQASVLVGTFSSKINIKNLEKLEEFGKLIGLSFQIMDDILDIEGDLKIIGKTTGKDTKNNKLTYPSVHGLLESKHKLKNLIDKSVKILNDFQQSNFLKMFIHTILNTIN